VSLIERSTGSVGITGGVPTRERVVGFILILRPEPEELVIIASRPRIRTCIIKRTSNNNNKYSSIIRSKVILIV